MEKVIEPDLKMLRIRNMESDRCKTVVIYELNKLGMRYKSVDLGEVELSKNITDGDIELFAIALSKFGLELIIKNTDLIVIQIKEAIKQLVYFSNDLLKPNFSSYISKNVNRNYNYLSKVFTETEGTTIENYYIKQRIERVKELIMTSQISLCEIAYTLYFSSVAHMSNQFKKVTGMTPVTFKNLNKDKLN
jgi:AraC-like DNA-binding protein